MDAIVQCRAELTEREPLALLFFLQVQRALSFKVYRRPQ